MTAPAATLVALLAKGDRGPIRLEPAFVGSEDAGGPLARFLRERRGRALDLYLLLRAVVPPSGKAVALPAIVWARALGVDDLASPDVLISRNWSWLEEHGLVWSERRGRLRAVRVADAPQAGDPFALPDAYFLGNYHNRVSLAGKVVLLVALSRGGRFSFVSGPPPSWHGLSRDSVKRGIRVLLTLGLLGVDTVRVADALTTAGYRVDRRYALQPPFAMPTARSPGIGADRLS